MRTLWPRSTRATVGQMYTDDAYLLPPGAEIVKGRTPIEKFWTGAAAALATQAHDGGREGAWERCGPRDRHLHPKDQRRQTAGGRREVRGRLGEDGRAVEARPT